MTNTLHYRLLRREVTRLKTLLPKVSLFGKYTDLSVRRTIAFRVLGHAALETYFESLSRELLESSFSLWNKQRVADELLLSVCLRFSRLGSMKDSEFLEKQKGNVILLVEAAREWHKKSIIENHGVMESNLDALFLPFGRVIRPLLDPLVARLEPYGRLRGEYAHTSASAITVPNPADEQAVILDILQAVQPIDGNLRAFI